MQPKTDPVYQGQCDSNDDMHTLVSITALWNGGHSQTRTGTHQTHHCPRCLHGKNTAQRAGKWDLHWWVKKSRSVGCGGGRVEERKNERGWGKGKAKMRAGGDSTPPPPKARPASVQGWPRR